MRNFVRYGCYIKPVTIDICKGHRARCTYMHAGSEGLIMDVEAQRLDILQYYIGGKVYNPVHNKTIIRELKNLDYLRCGITSDLEETIMTTDYGLLYLDISGIVVDTPIIEGGRIKTTREAAI